MTNNTMGNGELLVLKDLNVWYTKDKPVLEHFSVELGNNEAVGLIGLNGAGKTTFIKTLSGLTGLIFRVPNTCTSRSAAIGNTEQSFFRPIFLKVSALRPTG